MAAVKGPMSGSWTADCIYSPETDVICGLEDARRSVCVFQEMWHVLSKFRFKPKQFHEIHGANENEEEVHTGCYLHRKFNCIFK